MSLKKSPPKPANADILSLSAPMYAVALLDYAFVISIYVTVSFSLAVLIDGHILPPYDQKVVDKESSFELAWKILAQFALQGFIAVLLSAALQKIPSPMAGVYGYDTHGPLGGLLRNPAIISVVLFALSQTLQGRLRTLFARFDRNAAAAANSSTTTNL